MARKKRNNTKILKPDSVYNSLIVSKLINYCMMDGKKEIAKNQIYQALESIKKTQKIKNPVVYLEESIDKIRPRVEVRPRRIGGAVYQVPTPVRGHRQLSLALRWLVSASRKRPNKLYHNFYQKLLAELEDIQKEQGEAFKKRQDAEKMAEANKAFSHLRW